MEDTSVIRLGLILAIQAEIEGMKAENENRKQNQESMMYINEHFKEKAEDLRYMASCHSTQL